MRNPFRYFDSSPEVIRLVVMMYIRYPLSLRQVEDLLFERGMGFDDVIVAGSGFLGVDTPLGPIYLAYGHADGGNDAVYFLLGQRF